MKCERCEKEIPFLFRPPGSVQVYCARCIMELEEEREMKIEVVVALFVLSGLVLFVFSLVKCVQP